MSIKALCPNLICRNPRVKVLFGYRKNTYQRQTDRFLIRNTEDDDVIKNGSRPDGVEPRPSATPKYDMYMAGAQMAGAQIKRAQITSKTNRWLNQPFVCYRFSLWILTARTLSRFKEFLCGSQTTIPHLYDSNFQLLSKIYEVFLPSKSVKT